MKLSEPLLATCRLVPCLRPDGSWTRGRNGNMLVWMETAAGITQHVVPGGQLGWQLHLPGRPWLQPPDV